MIFDNVCHGVPTNKIIQNKAAVSTKMDKDINLLVSELYIKNHKKNTTRLIIQEVIIEKSTQNQDKTGQQLLLLLYYTSMHKVGLKQRNSVSTKMITYQILQLLLPQQMKRQKLKSNFDWHDNNYEPGLFTFYREGNSLESKRQERHEDRPYNARIKIRRNSKSEMKLDYSRKYITQYLDISQRKTAPKIIESKQYTPANISEIKFVSTPPKEPAYQHKSINKNLEAQTVKKMRIAMKSNNMSSYFKYDINKTRKNMFIFRGDCTNLYLRFNNSEARVPLRGEDGRKYAHDGLKDNQTQRSRRVDTISYSQAQTTNSKPRTNILQFLLDRKKKGITHRQVQVSPVSTVDLTLGKFTRYKRPNLSELSSFLKN